jgi:hypothetical protein
MYERQKHRIIPFLRCAHVFVPFCFCSACVFVFFAFSAFLVFEISL